MNMKDICTRREIGYVSIGFLLSLLHWTVCLVYFVALLCFLRQGIAGCVKGLLILTTRGILSTAVGAGISGPTQIVKWALIFVFSLYILYFQRLDQVSFKQLRIVNMLQLLVWIFAIYNIVVSFITGSYPIVSAFKVFSYVIPFTAIIIGVSITQKKIDWSEYCYLLLSPLILFSAVTIPFGNFKIVNDSFQGIINHPNLFGIFGAIYICFLLYSNFSTKKKSGLDWKRVLLLILTFVMIFLSQSRTGMFSALAILIIYFLTMNLESKVRLVIGLIIVGVVVAFYFMIDESSYVSLIEQINTFIYKRDTDDVLQSRLGQIDASKIKYEANQLLGSGFGVPYDPYVKNFSFSLDLTYEAGNLFISVLGDSGIIGLVLFIVYMGYILINSNSKKWILFFAPIVISLGEMAFFATNNIAIYYYIMFGICLCVGEEETVSVTQHNSTGI